MTAPLRFLAEEDIRALLTWDALIPAIRAALIDYTAGRIQQPPRTILRAGNATDHRNGWFAVMPVVAADVMGVKTVTFYPGNAELGLPTHMAVIELIRRSTGEPLAVMDGRLITEMRTAAVSAVAFAAIAPLHFAAPPSTLGILGSGVQARAHIHALRRVWPQLSRVRIHSRNLQNASRLAAEINAEFSSGLDARAASAEEASAAEVVLTATSSPIPVLLGSRLAANTLILAVGGTGASLRELDDDAMRSAFVIAEGCAPVEREAGDILLSDAPVQAEIGEILIDPSATRVPIEGRVVFKSVGMAIEDITAAELIWRAHNQSRR